MEYIYDIRAQEIRSLECPFCKKEALKAVYPQILQMRKSNSAVAGTKTKFILELIVILEAVRDERRS